jgi:hypothetical protein
VTILERAAAAGARRASLLPVRLAAEVLPVFEERLAEAYPGRVGKVTHALLQIRGGRMNDPSFGGRMRGQGPRWEVLSALFIAHCRRLGLDERAPGAALDAPPSTFRRSRPQGELF